MVFRSMCLYLDIIYGRLIYVFLHVCLIYVYDIHNIDMYIKKNIYRGARDRYIGWEELAVCAGKIFTPPHSNSFGSSAGGGGRQKMPI